MHVSRLLALALVAGGCASAGGGIFPEAGEPVAAVARAEALIQDAVRAGADSLAAEAIAAARRNVTESQVAQRGHDANRAALFAREAQADATYAKAAAERAKADRARTDAEAALKALPPGGAR